MRSYILAIDVGTSAVKASLVADDLRIVAGASQAYPTHFPAPRCAEQRAQDWWEAARKAVQALAQADMLALQSVEAIAVSGHMMGMLPVDARGEPLTPSLIHADTRATAQMERVEALLGAERAYQQTGNTLSPSSTLCKALWLHNEHPDIARRCAKILQCKDYLNFRLTGELDVTDFSDASHAMLIDIHTRRYLADVFAELGLRGSLFPSLHRSTDVIGRLSPEAAAQLGLRAGIPVAAGGGDGACATVGAGIVRAGDAYCSLGTTAWIACSMDAPYLDPSRRVFNILALDGEHVGVFGTMQSAGRSIQWVQGLLQIDDVVELGQLAAKADALCDGLVFLPYLEGERSPIFDPQARGVFFGIRASHGREHFARAVFEGVSFALGSILDVLRERLPIQEIRIIGGGAKSELWRQMIANAGDVRICGIDVSAENATSLGAAAAAGVAAGWFPDVSCAAKRVQVTGRTFPDHTCAGYRAQIHFYQSLYPLLKPAFHDPRAR